MAVEEGYSFETTQGTKSLAELFDGRAQLLVYHFMFGPPYEAGCPVCSSIADNLDPNAVHLAARDTTLLLCSRAPLEKLQTFKQRMGWRLNWVSTAGNDFHRDLGFAQTEADLAPFRDWIAAALGAPARRVLGVFSKRGTELRLTALLLLGGGPSSPGS